MALQTSREFTEDFHLQYINPPADRNLCFEETMEIPVIQAPPTKTTTKKKSIKPSRRRPKKKKYNLFAFTSDALFYMAVLAIMLFILSSGSNNGMPKTLMGYSCFIVLTSSMTGEIPKGSFVLVKQTPPQDLVIGDNVTYMLNPNATVTHKIIAIYENYQNSGARGFQTKGVHNADPDKDIVYEANIVGKVVFCLPGVGPTLNFMEANIFVVFIILGMILLISFILRVLFAKSASKKRSHKKRRPGGNKGDLYNAKAAHKPRKRASWNGPVALNKYKGKLT